MKTCGLFLCAAAVMGGCDSSEDPGWRSAGQLSDGLRAKFVEVEREHAHKRSTYDAAVAALCKGERICVVGFFLRGDKIPPPQSSKQFFGSGGWASYAPTAVWWSNKNTGLAHYPTWDCLRAGVAAAPLEALCGEGVSQAHEALLAIAARAGMAQACGWPKTQGPSVAAAYIAKVADAKRRAFNQTAYDDMFASSQKGPDDRADCKRLRTKIEDGSKRAENALPR